MADQNNLRLAGMDEEEATLMILWWHAWQLNRERIRHYRIGRYSVDITNPEPWPRLMFHPTATWALAPLPPPLTPPTYVVTVCERFVTE